MVVVIVAEVQKVQGLIHACSYMCYISRPCLSSYYYSPVVVSHRYGGNMDPKLQATWPQSSMKLCSYLGSLQSTGGGAPNNQKVSP